MTMLKALVNRNLVDPSHVSIDQRTPSHYQIQIKSDYCRKELVDFAERNGLTICEDKERKYLRIYKP